LLFGFSLVFLLVSSAMIPIALSRQEELAIFVLKALIKAARTEVIITMRSFFDHLLFCDLNWNLKTVSGTGVAFLLLLFFFFFSYFVSKAYATVRSVS
jgi:hypothetical protein